jgi:hypothetical protein
MMDSKDRIQLLRQVAEANGRDLSHLSDEEVIEQLNILIEQEKAAVTERLLKAWADPEEMKRWTEALKRDVFDGLFKALEPTLSEIGNLFGVKIKVDPTLNPGEIRFKLEDDNTKKTIRD